MHQKGWELLLQANGRYRRSRYEQIQLHRTDLLEVSGPIRIKLKKVNFRANCYFQVHVVQRFAGPKFLIVSCSVSIGLFHSVFGRSRQRGAEPFTGHDLVFRTVVLNLFYPMHPFYRY